MNNKKLIVGDLRVLKRTEGGALISVGDITMHESQMTGQQISTSQWIVKDWPLDWPDIRGLNEMWAGENDDKELVLTMLNESLDKETELVLNISCTVDMDCPTGMICKNGICV